MTREEEIRKEIKKKDNQILKIAGEICKADLNLTQEQSEKLNVDAFYICQEKSILQAELKGIQETESRILGMIEEEKQTWTNAPEIELALSNITKKIRRKGE